MTTCKRRSDLRDDKERVGADRVARLLANREVFPSWKEAGRPAVHPPARRPAGLLRAERFLRHDLPSATALLMTQTLVALNASGRIADFVY